MERLKYHFEPRTGWINDPNGLIYWKGKYHAFFQHNPKSPKWDVMHWGHCVSEDLVNWTELPIALYPDQKYENSFGCFSGSAVEADGRMYIFYTAVSHEYGQAQAVAYTDDGVNYIKYEGNPVIRHFPEDGSADFRDPKVSLIDGSYYMAVASGRDGVGKVLLYKAKDTLFDWEYMGVLYENKEFGGVYECPDFYRFGDEYVLMFSQMGNHMNMKSSIFITGGFDGKKFSPKKVSKPETGPHFYAPQSFYDPGKNRRIYIGWVNAFDIDTTASGYTGAFTIPRELRIVNGEIYDYPVAEAQHLLKDSDELVEADGHIIKLRLEKEYIYSTKSEIKDLKILRDTSMIEIFVNGGEESFTQRINLKQ